MLFRFAAFVLVSPPARNGAARRPSGAQGDTACDGPFGGDLAGRFAHPKPDAPAAAP